MIARASTLAITAIAALGSSFLAPADAFASTHGFAHAAQVSRSAHASTVHVVRVRTGSRSTSFQHSTSSGTVASESFTRNRFRSANRTFGHTNQFNTTHAATFDPCRQMPYPASCFHGQGKGVDGTGGSAASLGAKQTTNIGSPVLTPVTEPALPTGSGNSSKTTGGTGTGTGGPVFTPPTKTGGGTGGTGTGGTGSGTGGSTFTPGKTTSGGDHHRHPFPGHHPFPGQFPVAMGHGVGGPVGGGGSVAPVALGPVASGGGTPTPVTPSSVGQPSAPSCLTKSYLQTGVVLFRDVCSQEWAIGNSSVTNPLPVNSACLSKENPQNGVVLFKDNCTSESAMNPQPSDNKTQAN